MAKQDWSVGNTVKVGGRPYIVLGHVPPKQAGEAKGYTITPEGDRTRVYEWIPFRGLSLVSGELVRPKRKRNRAKAKAAKAAAALAGNRRQPAAIVPKGGLFGRLMARFGKRVNPRGHSTITRVPSATIRR